MVLTSYHSDIAQMHKLVQGLQQLAKDSGHTRPLMIGTDQENGRVRRSIP